MLLLLSALVSSCGTGPKPEAASLAPEPVEPTAPVTPSVVTSHVEEVAEVPVKEPAKEPAEVSVEKEFDPNSISEAVYKAAKSEITITIFELNWIIKARDYKAWVAHLADSYFKEISSKNFLDEKTEELYKRDQIVAHNLGKDPNTVEKHVLRTARDYFDYVVVPSRQNDHVDAIDFNSENRVTAYTVDNRGSRLVLYNLELINNGWKIIH